MRLLRFQWPILSDHGKQMDGLPVVTGDMREFGKNRVGYREKYKPFHAVRDIQLTR